MLVHVHTKNCLDFHLALYSWRSYLAFHSRRPHFRSANSGLERKSHQSNNRDLMHHDVAQLGLRDQILREAERWGGLQQVSGTKMEGTWIQRKASIHSNCKSLGPYGMSLVRYSGQRLQLYAKWDDWKDAYWSHVLLGCQLHLRWQIGLRRTPWQSSQKNHWAPK